MTTLYGVTTDYDYTGKRDRLEIWSGSFFHTWEAEAYSLPKNNGYMLTTYNGDKVRVECPVPRDSDTYEEIDSAISAALNKHFASIGATTLLEA